MAVYTGTEHFIKKEVEAVSDILRARGFREEWSIITPFQQEIKMYNILKNEYAYVQKMKTHITVTYSKQGEIC